MARVQILPFPIGFRCRPYSTMALPCECAIDYRLIKKDLAIRALDWYFTSTITQFKFIILCRLFLHDYYYVLLNYLTS